MGEALISRRGGTTEAKVENLDEYYNSSKLQYEGFDFINHSYFFRLSYIEDGGTTRWRYIYNFIVERGGTVIELSSYYSSGSTSGSFSPYEFIKEIQIDVAQGTMYPNRKYATFMRQKGEEVCVMLS